MFFNWDTSGCTRVSFVFPTFLQTHFSTLHYTARWTRLNSFLNQSHFIYPFWDKNEVKMTFLPVHAHWCWFACQFHVPNPQCILCIYSLSASEKKHIYWLIVGNLLWICMSKPLMTLIQHTETTTCTFTQPPHAPTASSIFWLALICNGTCTLSPYGL